MLGSISQSEPLKLTLGDLSSPVQIQVLLEGRCVTSTQELRALLGKILEANRGNQLFLVAAAAIHGDFYLRCIKKHGKRTLVGSWLKRVSGDGGSAFEEDRSLFEEIELSNFEVNPIGTLLDISRFRFNSCFLPMHGKTALISETAWTEACKQVAIKFLGRTNPNCEKSRDGTHVYANIIGNHGEAWNFHATVSLEKGNITKLHLTLRRHVAAKLFKSAVKWSYPIGVRISQGRYCVAFGQPEFIVKVEDIGISKESFFQLGQQYGRGGSGNPKREAAFPDGSKRSIRLLSSDFLSLVAQELGTGTCDAHNIVKWGE